VDVFLKNTAVGDVMFRELYNFKKSYNNGDIPLVYMADTIHTQALASTISNSSLQHSYHELTLNVSKVLKPLSAISAQTCDKHIYCAPPHEFRQYAVTVLTFLLTILKNPFTPESVCNFLRCFCCDVISYLAKGY